MYSNTNLYDRIKAWQSYYLQLSNIHYLLTSTDVLRRASSDHLMDDLMAVVVYKHGLENACALLAYTVNNDANGFYDTDIREWAAEFEPVKPPMPDSKAYDDLIIHEHPAIINEACRCLFRRLG